FFALRTPSRTSYLIPVFSAGRCRDCDRDHSDLYRATLVPPWSSRTAQRGNACTRRGEHLKSGILFSLYPVEGGPVEPARDFAQLQLQFVDGLALLDTVRTWCFVREGRCHKNPSDTVGESTCRVTTHNKLRTTHM